MIRPCVRRACIAAVALTCLAGAAKAQSTHRSIDAEALFTEGHTLLTAGRIQEACPRLAESARIEAHPATMLALAECSEKSGRLADAAAQLRTAASLVGHIGDEHAQNALRHAAAIEAKLPRLVVVMNKPVDGLEVRRDGVLLPPDQLGLDMPVDGGEHTISATAPGRRPWSVVVKTQHTDTTTVEVPALELAQMPLDTAAGSTPAYLRTTILPPIDFDSSSSRPRSTGVKLATLSLGLLGAASVGTGAFLGLRAKQISDSLDGRCRAQNACDPNSSELRSQSQRDAIASTVAFGAGAAAITAGALLWLLSPSNKRPKAAISPNVDFHRIAFTFSRTW